MNLNTQRTPREIIDARLANSATCARICELEQTPDALLHRRRFFCPVSDRERAQFIEELCDENTNVEDATVVVGFSVIAAYRTS